MIKEPAVNNSATKPVFTRQLDRFWRVFGTGLSFSVFGIGGLFMGIFMFPLMFVLVRNRVSRQIIARRLIGRAFAIFLGMMKALGCISYAIRGDKRSAEAGQQLIIANHPTLIDVVFLVALFPLADCVVKEAVMRNPFMRGVVRPANYISSDEPGILLETCVERIKSGASLILFPEGTRSRQNQSLEFKLGAASIAVRSGAGILPVVIKCSQPGFLAKNHPWYRVPPERPLITIDIHPQISLREITPGDLEPRQAARKLNSALLDFFQGAIA